jgi:hypothetical protein
MTRRVLPKQLFYFELIDNKIFYNRCKTPCILWFLGFKGLQFCNICSKSNYFSKIIS